MLEPPPRHTVRTRANASPAAPTVHDLRPTNKPTATPPSFPPSRCIQAGSPQRILPSTLPATTMPTPLPRMLSPHYIPPDDDTRVPTLQQPKRATRIISTRNPASITMHALYHVINLAFNNPPGYTIPKNLIVTTDDSNTTSISKRSAMASFIRSRRRPSPSTQSSWMTQL